ncbi:MAG: alkaline phosphatase family protein [Candidatus Aminicenantes bacterium]|nr:alkaline phosphatase family protein [Candidatus Aminicenantes bacterium]
MAIGRKSVKLLVIGLDGVSYEMLAGGPGRPSLLPRMREFFAGAVTRMSASIPEISAVSWSSFMTGTQPGEHGIFGFVDLAPGSYRYRFPDFRDLKAAPFFDELGTRHRRSVIINLPATYPARPVPGVLISGFVALDLERAVYPQRYLPMLRQAGYQVDVDAGKGRDKKAEFLADLNCSLKIRRQVADMLWQREEWDVFMFTVTGTDRLMHFLYDAYEDPDHELHDEVRSYYLEVDQAATSLLQRAAAREDVEVIALSDHGFGPIQSEVYLNPILARNGFFSLDGGEPKGLGGISESAKAFALDPSRLYVHGRGKYPRGSVAAADYERVRRDLRDLFAGYEVGGRRVIRRVFFKEELYRGGQLASAPDLVLLSEPGYDLKGGLEKTVEAARSHFTGMHCQDNAFLACRRPELVGEAPDIFGVKRLMYRLLAI